MDIWTIYHNPSDYPGLYVARRASVIAGSIAMDANAHVAKTLEDARALIPPGLVCVGRRAVDDPVIVESWL